MVLHKHLCVSAVLCFLGSISVAAADTIKLAYVAVEAGGNENITLNSTTYSGANGLMKVNTQNPVGPLASQIPAATWAFCFELGQYTDFPYTSYNVQTLASAMAPAKAELIRQLWAQHYNPAWQSNTYIYYGGSFGGWTSGQPSNTTENQQALAMNFAIYEILYDFSGSLASLNLSSGSFKVNSANPSAATTTASNWLSSLVQDSLYSGPKANLLGLTSSTLQDLIVEIPPSTNVPEPASAALLVLSASAILFRRR